MEWKESLKRLSAELEHPAWGQGHVRRVHDLSLELARRQGLKVDDDVLFAAACLHDFGAFPAYRRSGVDHADRSAELAVDLLPEYGFPEDKVGRVRQVIAGHMFYRMPGSAPEEAVFHDADVLDFMGWVGITRMLSIVGLDDWAPDVRTAVERIVRFSTELPDSLVTEAGREIGRVRREEMVVFLSGLAEETHHLLVL